MTERAPLARSELEIARIVWNLGEATVRQVLEALPAERELDFYTVQTYLRRLKSKGYLETRRDGRNNIYSPAIQPGHVVKEITDDFLHRLFDGETLPLFQHLIENQDLSRGEIDQLQEMLNRLKKEEGE